MIDMILAGEHGSFSGGSALSLLDSMLLNEHASVSQSSNPTLSEIDSEGVWMYVTVEAGNSLLRLLPMLTVLSTTGIWLNERRV